MYELKNEESVSDFQNERVRLGVVNTENLESVTYKRISLQTFRQSFYRKSKTFLSIFQT